MHHDETLTEHIQTPLWNLKEDSILRTFEFKGFVEAMAFVNKVAQVAETLEHHPDIAIAYNKVTLTLSTHSAGGLTQKDFDLARAIDSIA